MGKTTLKPIEDLIVLAKEGNGLAFTALWDRYIAHLRNFIKSWINSINEIDVDDICSRSFEKAFRQIHNYDSSKSQFFTWLMIIAKNTALDMLAKEKRVYPDKRVLYIDSDSSIRNISTSYEDPLDK